MISHKKLKTVDISARTWVDEVYGNSYFSAQVTVNLAMKGENTFYIPWTYGHGGCVADAAIKVLAQVYDFPPKYYDERKTSQKSLSLYLLRSEFGVISRIYEREGKKADMISFGIAPKVTH